MRPSNILGSLSAARSPMWSSTVVPLPNPHSSGNRTTTFDNLKLSFKNKINIDGISATHLLRNVADSITSQKNIVEIISDPNPNVCNPMLIEECLEDGVELLDACNFLLEKIEFVRKYADSIQMAVHLIKPGMAPVAITRVRELLERKRYYGGDVDQCRSRLKRVVSNLKRRRGEYCDILTSSTADAVDACQRLDRALSFKRPRGRRSSAGGSTEQMVELRDAMRWAKRLRDLTEEKGGEVDRSYVETLKDTCQELVEGVGPLEERVKELYSQLLCVRMALLGILSHHHS